MGSNRKMLALVLAQTITRHWIKTDSNYFYLSRPKSDVINPKYFLHSLDLFFRLVVGNSAFLFQF